MVPVVFRKPQLPAEEFNERCLSTAPHILLDRFNLNLENKWTEHDLAGAYAAQIAKPDFVCMATCDGSEDISQPVAAQPHVVCAKMNITSGFVFRKFYAQEQSVGNRDALPCRLKLHAEDRHIACRQTTRIARTLIFERGIFGVQSAHRRIRIPFLGVSICE